MDNNQPPSSGGAAPAAPKRDKFAALASRSAQTPAEIPAPAAQPATATAVTIPVASAPRGDKLAALAAAQASAAAAQTAQHVTNSSSLSNEPMDVIMADNSNVDESKWSNLRKSTVQRQETLATLDRAEQLSCTLLELAKETTDALQDMSAESDIKAISHKYRTTLQEIHGMLSSTPDNLIQAYRNHSSELDSSMYETRVEMRLAQERTQVLGMFATIEEETTAEGAMQTRDNGTVTAATPIQVTQDAISIDDGNRKRSRE